MFPSYESHYLRNDNPHRKYLAPNLNMSIMYDLYKFPYHFTCLDIFFPQGSIFIFIDPTLTPAKSVIAWMQKSKVFQILWNWSKPKQHELYLRKAEAAKARKCNDVANATMNVAVLTFDSQKTLPSDHLCGRGVTSLPLIQWAQVQIPVRSVSWLTFFPGFSLNCKTNVRKFRSHLSPGTIFPS